MMHMYDTDKTDSMCVACIVLSWVCYDMQNKQNSLVFSHRFNHWRIHLCCLYITIYINGTLINSTAGTGICTHNRVMPYLFIHFIPFPLWCPWIIPQPADFLINGDDIQVGQTYRTAAQGNTSWGLDSLQWRHIGRDGVSNHQPHHCLLNRLFRRRSKKTSKVRATGLCAGNSPAGNSPVTGEFPAQRASNQVTRKMFPFDDVIKCEEKCIWVYKVLLTCLLTGLWHIWQPVRCHFETFW